MGTIKGGFKWSNAIIDGFITSTIIKNGKVIWQKIGVYIGLTNQNIETGNDIKEYIPSFGEQLTYKLQANGLYNTYVVALPQHKTLVSIITSNNETLYHKDNIEESNFILSEDITTIPDENGIERSYKVYMLTTVGTFSKNMFLTVTIQ